ncbi:hypothetical protein SCP_0800240 [Sparassis crispa]|uniref:Uncharacterized protein n=1 Tax=Sparassis crispa TaxID=139825 RepID=A0A401GTG6_9APHY|nr:hypothetical protein SCP_0800240 [Sparassis crispa]GBE85507.1 hypothetical protein SCP_0800240 [Sparassis crispa]
MWRSDAHLAHEKPKAASVTWLPYTLIDQVLAAVDTQERFLIRASVSSQRMADRDFQPHKMRAKIRPVIFCFPISANHGGTYRKYVIQVRPSAGPSFGSRVRALARPYSFKASQVTAYTRTSFVCSQVTPYVRR